MVLLLDSVQPGRGPTLPVATGARGCSPKVSASELLQASCPCLNAGKYHNSDKIPGVPKNTRPEEVLKQTTPGRIYSKVTCMGRLKHFRAQRSRDHNRRSTAFWPGELIIPSSDKDTRLNKVSLITFLSSIKRGQNWVRLL